MQWKDEFYIDAYEYSKAGLDNERIAKQIGCGRDTFYKWLKEKPLLKYAIEKPRTTKSGNTVNFKNYVYDQLPPEIKEIWDRINRYDRVKNGVQKIEAILESKGVEVRQHLFFYALINCNFNASMACKKLNISIPVLRKWIENDPDFATLMEEINFHKGNFFESSLIGLVQGGDTNATIFANKTFNKNRGYGEKFEVNHTGEITHQHLHKSINIESLDLPLDVRRQILVAIRKQQERQEGQKGQEGQLLLENRQEGQDD